MEPILIIGIGSFIIMKILKICGILVVIVSAVLVVYAITQGEVIKFVEYIYIRLRMMLYDR